MEATKRVGGDNRSNVESEVILFILFAKTEKECEEKIVDGRTWNSLTAKKINFFLRERAIINKKVKLVPCHSRCLQKSIYLLL